jgi:predicted Zn-dependent peptidase
MEEQILNQLDTVDEQTATDAAETQPKKRKRTPGPPRGPSRPYKKHDQATIENNVAKMRRQKDVMQSKLLLLTDRLEKYEAELEFRASA